MIRIGNAAKPDNRKVKDVPGTSSASLAKAIDALQTDAAGSPTDAVVVAPADSPQFAMPAAGWAAKSGQPVLWTLKDSLPAETRAAIAAHPRRRGSTCSGRRGDRRERGHGARQARQDEADLRARPGGERDRVRAFTRRPLRLERHRPGHGLVFANASRTLDAASAAPLSGSGQYGPLLLVTEAASLPAPVQEYLLDIQPGYEKDPVRGVYNHGWLMGDETAISPTCNRASTPSWRSSPSRAEASDRMAEAEQPERMRADRQVTVDDVRQLMGASTPHFALQIRNRIRRLIAGLPPDDPARVLGEQEIARLELLAFTGEVRGEGYQDGQRPLPSVSEFLVAE